MGNDFRLKSFWKVLSPFSWSKRTLLCVIFGFFAISSVIFANFLLKSADAVSAVEISGELSIPSIDLSSPVTSVKMEGKTLPTPDYIVGEYSEHFNKTLLFAHSKTAFKNLSSVDAGDELTYDGETYLIIKTEVLPKEEIDMKKLLSSSEEKTLVLMTCAGEEKDGEFSHRFIATAELLN